MQLPLSGWIYGGRGKSDSGSIELNCCCSGGELLLDNVTWLVEAIFPGRTGFVLDGLKENGLAYGLTGSEPEVGLVVTLGGRTGFSVTGKKEVFAGDRYFRWSGLSVVPYKISVHSFK